jgi:transposase-like protein
VLQICTFTGTDAIVTRSLERGYYGLRVCPMSLLSERAGDQRRPDRHRQTQRYRCHNPNCSHQSFLLDSAYKGRSPAIKQQVIELSLNGSGVRDTARVLGISPTTVIQELKKKGPHSHL